jgi:hypothetical protein
MPQTISNQGVQVDLTVMQGASLILNLTCTNPADGTPASLVDCFLNAKIRKAALSGTIAAAFETSITDATGGLATLILGPSVSGSLVAGESLDDDAGQYVWDLALTDSDGNVSFPIYGNVSVFRQVTR